MDREQEVCSFPVLAGHPPKRGRGQVQEEATLQRVLLSKVATGVELKHHWAKREGFWRNSSRLTPRLPPRAREAAHPPQAQVYLSQNGYCLSRSLSCFAWGIGRGQSVPCSWRYPVQQLGLYSKACAPLLQRTKQESRAPRPLISDSFGCPQRAFPQ